MLDSIKENLKNNQIRTVLKSLYDMATDLPDSEFYDIVGETFMFDPELFMKKIYENFMEKMDKLIDLQKRKEMERYIIKKYCLAENEKLLYELKGNIYQSESEQGYSEYRAVRLSINSADIFITNKRMIVNGKLKVEGGKKKEIYKRDLSDLIPETLDQFIDDFLPGGSKRRKGRKQALIESSPVFGYQFPTKIPKSLFKTKKSVGYFTSINKLDYYTAIRPTDKSKREDVQKIFDILRKDVNQVLELIKGIHDQEKKQSQRIINEEREKNRMRIIWGILKSLYKSEEFINFTDSDRVSIIKETYQLDPELFMAHVYPKMIKWKNSSFLQAKEQLFELLRKEGASI